MKTTTFQQIILEASDGMYLYNKNNKVIGKVAYLGRFDTPENWEEITEERKVELEAQWEKELEEEAE